MHLLLIIPHPRIIVCISLHFVGFIWLRVQELGAVSGAPPNQHAYTASHLPETGGNVVCMIRWLQLPNQLAKKNFQIGVLFDSLSFFCNNCMCGLMINPYYTVRMIWMHFLYSTTIAHTILITIFLLPGFVPSMAVNCQFERLWGMSIVVEPAVVIMKLCRNSSLWCSG